MFRVLRTCTQWELASLVDRHQLAALATSGDMISLPVGRAPVFSEGRAAAQVVVTAQHALLNSMYRYGHNYM